MYVKEAGRHVKTVEMDKSGNVIMVDQRALPAFRTVRLKGFRETAEAIRDMTVRGAGAIGVAAAFAMAQAHLEGVSPVDAKRYIDSTRPTAYNLFHATRMMLDSADPVADARRFAEEEDNACQMIGEHGATLIKDGSVIGTHCNAGWLAFVDWGSALSPIYAAKRQGKSVTVFVDETRPWLQGARLTSWELQQEEIKHFLIADNAAGYYMWKKALDMLIVGADRIAANGDVANKIGTYEKAVLAKENGIPFYVAAPLSTIDLATPSGEDIKIEERSESEVTSFEGRKVAPEGTRARNPVFDITPARYITGIITPNGIFRPEDIKATFGNIHHEPAGGRAEQGDREAERGSAAPSF